MEHFSWEINLKLQCETVDTNQKTKKKYFENISRKNNFNFSVK
jgi:hypothetical protein